MSLPALLQRARQAPMAMLLEMNREEPSQWAAWTPPVMPAAGGHHRGRGRGGDNAGWIEVFGWGRIGRRHTGNRESALLGP